MASLLASPAALLKQLIALRQIIEVETAYVSNVSVIIEVSVPGLQVGPI